MKKVIYLYFLSILMPIGLFKIGNFTVGSSDCMMGMLIFFFIIFVIKRNVIGHFIKGKLDMSVFLLITFAIVSYVANLGSIDLSKTLTTFVKWLFAVSSFFIVFHSFSAQVLPKDLLRLKNVILAGSILVVALVWMNSLFPVGMSSLFKSVQDPEILAEVEWAGVVRYFLPYWGTNRLAPFLLLPTCISFAYLVLDEPLISLRKIGYACLVIIFGFVLIHTYTRMALIAFGIAACVVLLYASTYRKLACIVFVVGVSILLVALSPDFLLPYVEKRESVSYAPIIGHGSGVESYVSANVLGRLYINSLALEKFLDSPFLGVGFGSSLEGLWTTFGHAHNSFLTALYNLGLLGFVPYLLTVVMIFRITKRSIRVFREIPGVKIFIIAVYCWVVCLMVMSLSESVLFMPYEIVFILMLVTGTLCAALARYGKPAAAQPQAFLGRQEV
jgi:O-antigen ligase